MTCLTFPRYHWNMELPLMLLRNTAVVHDRSGDARGNVRVENAVVTVIGKNDWPFGHE